MEVPLPVPCISWPATTEKPENGNGIANGSMIDIPFSKIAPAYPADPTAPHNHRPVPDTCSGKLGGRSGPFRHGRRSSSRSFPAKFPERRRGRQSAPGPKRGRDCESPSSRDEECKAILWREKLTFFPWRKPLRQSHLRQGDRFLLAR